MTRFAKEIHHQVFRDADQAARARGSATLEAEHLLLALARRRDATGKLLAEHGLTPDGIDAALAAEERRSLAAVGVDVTEYDVPAPRPSRRGPRVAASLKSAMERTVTDAKDHRVKRITAPVLLGGILSAEYGTVPRALEAAGVDRVALRTRAYELADA